MTPYRTSAAPPAVPPRKPELWRLVAHRFLHFVRLNFFAFLTFKPCVGCPQCEGMRRILVEHQRRGCPECEQLSPYLADILRMR